MPMLVIATERAPHRLRGRLSLLLAEVRAGVFVGDYSRRARERLWDDVKTMIGAGNAVLIWAAATDTGFRFEAIGDNRRECVDMDGLAMVRFLPTSRDT